MDDRGIISNVCEKKRLTQSTPALPDLCEILAALFVRQDCLTVSVSALMLGCLITFVIFDRLSRVTM